MPPQLSQDLGADALFNQYVTVVNRAISANEHGLYGKAVKLWDKMVGDEDIAVGVYKDDAASPHHWYTVKLEHGHLDVVDTHKPADAGHSWKISDEHLAHVVDHPEKYVSAPYKLDLDWLSTRVGLA